MSARPDHFVIPELCNTTAIGLVVLFSQLLVVILLFAGSELSWMRFGLMSLYVQWVALGSAGLLCALRQPIARLDVLWGATSAAHSPAMIPKKWRPDGTLGRNA